MRDGLNAAQTRTYHCYGTDSSQRSYELPGGSPIEEDALRSVRSDAVGMADLHLGLRAAVVACVAIFAVGCGGDDDTTSGATPSNGGTSAASDGTPSATGSADADVCSDIDALKSSIDDLTNIDVSQAGLSSITDGLQQVQTDLSALKDNVGSGPLASQVDDLDQAVSSLSTSASAAVATPSVATLATVATDLGAVGSSLSALQQAAADVC